MRKDIDKLFIKSIETYLFLLVLVMIIKLLGGNYFNITLNNKSIMMIDEFITSYNLENIWYSFTLFINVYITLSITCNDNSKKMKKYSLFGLVIAIILQQLKTIYDIPILFVMIDFCYLFLLSIIYMKINKKKITKNNLINFIVYTLLLNLVQLISICTRNIEITNENSFFTYFVLNIDFLLMLIIIYKLYFLKGGFRVWVEEVFSGLQKLISLKNLLKKLQENSCKKLSKEEKIYNVIYIPLYLLWNLFTMAVIIFISMLNDAFIEAVFITLSFWINKRVFGKPFHFKSVYLCFIFSSVVYFILTRITFKIEDSILIPIFLGVFLSYFTSHLVEKEHKKKLYKGMPEEDFYELINKVTDDKLTIKMCKEYYCDREKQIKIARQNGYSIESFQKKKKKINDLIKEL